MADKKRCAIPQVWPSAHLYSSVRTEDKSTAPTYTWAPPIMNIQTSPLSHPCGPYPQPKMDATTAVAARRLLLLPLRAQPPAPRGAAPATANPWCRSVPRRRRVRAAPARASLDRAAVLLDTAAAVANGGTGYSQASYYTSLGLFVLSVPGLWSLIKRSVKSKVPDPSLRPLSLLPSRRPCCRLLASIFALSCTRARTLLLRSQRAHVHARVPCEQGAHRTRAWVRCVRATLARPRTVIRSRCTCARAYRIG
jgi:hypothetical protein